jgi:hypothetical protein
MRLSIVLCFCCMARAPTTPVSSASTTRPTPTRNSRPGVLAADLRALRTAVAGRLSTRRVPGAAGFSDTGVVTIGDPGHHS